LPCEVTGIEDFQWEEFYVFGPGNKMEYQKLRMNRPSYQDVFELTALVVDSDSEWSMFSDDLKAHVRRKADGKKFILGLSELKATNEVNSFRLLAVSHVRPLDSAGDRQ
jgi:hypothetical protein